MNNIKTALVLYGTRPEALKLAPLIVQMKRNHKYSTVVVNTGQHKELLAGIMELWNLAPDIDLQTNYEKDLKTSIDSLSNRFVGYLQSIKPNLVVVQGDTSSALIGAMQSYLMHIPVAHIEAGLRSRDIWNPWPEEGNRRIIDSISSQHYAPTESAYQNLVREGLGNSSTMTGNTIVDALEYVSRILDKNLEVSRNLEKRLEFSLSENYVLFTQHRREGFGAGQNSVFRAILEIAKKGIKVVFPVHPNPNVSEHAHIFFQAQKNVKLIDPLPYLEFVELMRNCSVVVSDSGGLQEEVPSLSKKIVVTRKTTERPEVVSYGFGSLVGYDEKLIFNRVINYLEESGPRAKLPNPFGDGLASRRIQDLICSFLTAS